MLGHRGGIGTALSAVALAVGGAELTGQDLADFDYENLSFRGIGVQVGAVFPNRLEGTVAYGGRIDLGYLGPGLRIVPGVTYWSSSFKRSEVAELEGQVEGLIAGELGPGVAVPDVDLGEITWSDLALSLDGHFVWSIPGGLLSFAGAGISAHLLNGEGEAIAGTFVEDLLDSVTAGVNGHAGLERSVGERFRLYGMARYELMGDLRISELRIGGQIMTGPSLPAERGRRQP